MLDLDTDRFKCDFQRNRCKSTECTETSDLDRVSHFEYTEKCIESEKSL